MAAILLVTWFFPGQPAHSYQTPFASMDACLVAKAAILDEARRLKDEAVKDQREPPTVAVACAVR